MHMGEVLPSKTDAVSMLLKTYMPQYSAQIDVLAGKTPAQAGVATKTTAAGASVQISQNTMYLLIGGGILLVVGLAVAMGGRKK